MQEFHVINTQDGRLIAHLHTKSGSNRLKNKGDMADNVKGVWVLVQPLY